MAIENYYHTLKVQSQSGSVDEYGDAQQALSAARDVMGYIGRPSTRAAQLAAQMGIEVIGRLYTAPDAGIKAFDVITDDDGTAYQVRSAPRDVARRGHHVEADLLAWRWA